MLTNDGDMGEGGGQILRTSLSLSLCQQRPFRIVNIRARRKKPGLRRQHLVAVQAASAIGRAQVEGAELGSGELTFIPRTLQPGDYRFDIGTAGSTTLVLQAVLPTLITASQPSHLIFEGGTHNPMAPPFDFLQQAFLPLLRRMGARVSARLERAGFYPVGGGILQVDIQPVAQLQALSLPERGRLLGVEAVAVLANLPGHIAERELTVLRQELALEQSQLHTRYLQAKGAGNALFVVVKSEHVTEVFTSFGQRGVRAESVAGRLVPQVQRYLRAEVAVGQHLADQLLLPLALARGGEFLTLSPDPHTPTNIAVLQRFMDIQVSTERQGSDRWLIRFGGGA